VRPSHCPRFMRQSVNCKTETEHALSETFIAHSEDGPELAIVINICEQLDTQAETFADNFAFKTLEAARRFVKFHNDAVERAHLEGAIKILADLMPILLARCKNRAARDSGLAFSIGWAERMNGIRDE